MIIYVFEKHENLIKPEKMVEFFSIFIVKIAGDGAVVEIFDKLEPEPHKNGPAVSIIHPTKYRYQLLKATFCIMTLEENFSVDAHLTANLSEILKSGEPIFTSTLINLKIISIAFKKPKG
jgi:hypothetical protein